MLKHLVQHPQRHGVLLYWEPYPEPPVLPSMAAKETADAGVELPIISQQYGKGSKCAWKQECCLQCLQNSDVAG